MNENGHGLVLGKFMPPHMGHEFLVRFAAAFASKLTVLVCSLRREPIPGTLRYQWMHELFPQVRVLHITDELPQEPHEHPRFWDLWRNVINTAVAEPIDYVFASEKYGVQLAAELNAKFIPVDTKREQVPVSGSLIRTAPAKYWEFIPDCVRPFFVKRVCLIGPESTGKSTLAKRLADHFRTAHVAEFARELLDRKQGVCAPEDIPLIVRGQLAAEDALARRANRVLICDTDPLITTVWSNVLFGHCPDAVQSVAQQRHYDLYLLLDVDVPWVDDAQRFLPHRRQDFFQRCQAALDKQQRPYRIIRGDWPDRFKQACEAISQLME
jgi:NadR type nicotinamide-nucleotide adenylyltransferase